jgi:hypothetical protein
MPSSETIGELYDRLPTGQWVNLPEHGVRVRRPSPFDAGELLLHHRHEQGQPITCGAPHGCVTAVIEDVRCSACLAALAEESP